MRNAQEDADFMATNADAPLMQFYVQRCRELAAQRTSNNRAYLNTKRRKVKAR